MDIEDAPLCLKEKTGAETTQVWNNEDTTTIIRCYGKSFMTETED